MLNFQYSTWKRNTMAERCRGFAEYESWKLYCKPTNSLMPFADFNYGEVQAAESLNDFLHKKGVVLKESKECRTVIKKQRS